MASSLWPHRFGEGGADVAGGVDTEVFDGRRALAVGELERQVAGFNAPFVSDLTHLEYHKITQKKPRRTQLSYYKNDRVKIPNNTTKTTIADVIE